MAFLRPRVGKKNSDDGDAGFIELLVQHFHGVASDHAYVVEARPLEQHEQMADSGFMYLDAEVINLGVICSGREQCLAVTEADLEHDRGRSAEHGSQVHSLIRGLDAIARPDFLERAALRVRRAARAAHETADLAVMDLAHRDSLRNKPATGRGYTRLLCASGMSVRIVRADFPCRLCGGNDLSLYHVMGNDGQFRYFKCARCHLVNYDLSTGLEQEHYDEPDKDPMDDSEPWNLDKDQSFNFLGRYLSPPGRMLDIGCGNGRLMYLARRAGWDVKGLELSPVMAKLVRQRLGAAVVVADFLDVEAEEIDAGKFDVICLRHVLEHLPECLPAMRKIRALLVTHGHVLIELPNVESISKKLKRFMTRRGIRKPVYPEDMEIGHANEYCRASFENLLGATGFELVRWETYSRKPLSNLIYNHVHIGSNARALIRAA